MPLSNSGRLAKDELRHNECRLVPSIQAAGLKVTNDLSRAIFWQKFILQRCNFPKPEALAKQYENADLFDFCSCGCNSFGVRIRSGASIAPLASVASYGLIFEANFHLTGEQKTLEILLFAGGSGNLEYVEIDCCANSFPVPDAIQVDDSPYHLFVHESLNE